MPRYTAIVFLFDDVARPGKIHHVGNSGGLHGVCRNSERNLVWSDHGADATYAVVAYQRD